MTPAHAAAVLAHGGGLPEAAMVAAPVLALGVFLVLERRARQRESADDDGPPPPSSQS